MKNNIKIKYLYNSSFKVETEKHILIFDYYLDYVEESTIREEDLNNPKKILVFASHSHGDHFSNIIFNWQQKRQDIKYILSSDINPQEHHKNINYLAAYDDLTLDEVYVKAFGSTDIGISFLIKLEDATIFHSGDLNWWHWYDESEEDNMKMEKMFKAEVAKLKGEEIDIVFFPIDSRLKDSYSLGPKYFIDEINPKVLIPMHFREDYAITKKFAEKNIKNDTKIYSILNSGQEIIIDK
jgi:L-ascorbate metabolism protein UlaG (beta-lactamase superfamily)